MNQQTDNAPDTLLEQVKELRLDIEEAAYDAVLAMEGFFVKQMADRIIEDAARIKELDAENERLRVVVSKYQEAERWSRDKGYQ